ncbi:MAG TPA: HAD family hydrolase [Burkholderiales bacterium]|nr:HAD family hydrolase [Burkholderiales bacterium]
MRIGVDFDNTLVSYDDIFHRVALEQGVIPASLARTKLAVRDHLRREGREEVWTEMQGTVYGARMDDVQAYPGALEFLKWAREQGIEVCIISHKTRHPFIGPKHDLHAAAQRWVDRHVGGIPTFFELTKEEKLERIRACGCEHYIDDLPEILLANGFPQSVQRVLFDPDGHHAHASADGLLRMRGWPEIHSHFSSRWKR